LLRNSAGRLCGAPTKRGIDAILISREVRATDDPWKINLFPKGTREHGKWVDAMLWAKEHLAFLHAEMLQSLPPEEASDKTFADNNLNILGRVFDVWAQAYFRVMALTDDAAEGYAEILIAVEEEFFKTATTPRSSPSFRQPGPSEVTRCLTQRRQHWVGQALRAVRECKEAKSATAKEQQRGQMSGVTIVPGSIPSGQSMGSPIVHMDLSFPLLRHVLIAGASRPKKGNHRELCREIVRLANRIQATENPELPATEAGDRWLERLSIEDRLFWEAEAVLIASGEFCKDFAIQLLRAGKGELAAKFEQFAACFRTLRHEFFVAPDASVGIETPASLPPSAAVSVEATTNSAPGPESTTDPANYARNWEAVEIRFLSDERTQVVIGERTEARNYAELGFEDGRSKKPNLAWQALRFLAESNGIITHPPNGQDWTKFEKRVQEIRKRLRHHFRLEDDPLPFTDGYHARFKISCSPSFDS